jgi:DNA polymerase-4
VRADRPRKSVGGERTFDRDLSSGPALREALERIIDIVWDRIERAGAQGRTVTLKMKSIDFTNMTRAKSSPRAVADKTVFASMARDLLEAVLPLPQPIRLMGLTLSALEGDHDDDDAEPQSGEVARQQAELPF